MTQTVAEHLVQRLRHWGVRRVYGYPGDGINGIIAALGRPGETLEFIQSRHEEMAAFEAVGQAKFGEAPGVCLATSGPGAVHLLNGLYDAKLDRVPVVAIVGQTARSAIGGAYQQEIDLHTLMQDVAGGYAWTVMVPEQLPNVLDRAMRTAVADRRPTVVIVPSDLQEEDYQPPAHAFKNVPSSRPGLAAPTVTPAAEEVQRAADVINAGDRVAILVGQGARNARAEVRELAEITRGGVAKALLGKDVFDDDPGYVTGAIGLLGTRPSWEMMRDCDTLVIVGSNLPYSQFLPEFGKRAVQIDIDPRVIGMRYPTEVNLIGDAACSLRMLLPLLARRTRDRARRRWRESIERNVRRWWDTMDRQAAMDADPVNPMRICSELASQVPSNAMITSDSGSAANWYARFIRMRGEMRGSLSGTLATMGCGVPYAIGAKFAHPDRPAVALVGDGAMQMNGLAELITIARYYPRWEDPRLVVCVLHNNDLNQVTWEERAMTGVPKTPFSQDLPDVGYAAFATAIGLTGIEIDDPERLAPAWTRALNADRPVVLDVHCDPDIPPIPPHAEFDQIKDTAKALALGDPDRVGVATKGARTKLRELIPLRR
ncbi:thiamine pyrophosphate-requiring protein [Marinactinospora rubrisoli]|uniref:Thiamine pyrophosphate-requiring protein n=1 Tax=Marinactinospora rubrisoli TaxID=2715399 RepID=A0ABW2KH27_9ACTN